MLQHHHFMYFAQTLRLADYDAATSPLPVPGTFSSASRLRCCNIATSCTGHKHFVLQITMLEHHHFLYWAQTLRLADYDAGTSPLPVLGTNTSSCRLRCCNITTSFIGANTLFTLQVFKIVIGHNDPATS